MSDLQRRLAKLEAEAGKDAEEWCTCPNKFDYREAIKDLDPDYNGTRDEDMICAVCGRKKTTIRVVLTRFTYGDEADALEVDEHGRVKFDYAQAINAIAPDPAEHE